MSDATQDETRELKPEPKGGNGEFNVEDFMKRALKFDEAAQTMLKGFKDHMAKLIEELKLPLLFQLAFAVVVDNKNSTIDQRAILQAVLQKDKKQAQIPTAKVIVPNQQMRRGLRL